MDRKIDNVELLDEYTYIKSICSDIRKMNIDDKYELKYFIDNKITYLDKYYIKSFSKNSPKNIRSRCLIENSIRKSVKKGYINGVVNYYKEMDLSKLSNVSQIIFYLKYTDKKLEILINKYFNVLSKLNLLCGEFKRFVVLYLIFSECYVDNSIFKNLVISDIEKNSLLYLLNNEKIAFRELKYDCSLIRVIRCIQNYILLNEMVIYDDDVLKKAIKIRCSSIKLSKPLGCENAFYNLVDHRIKHYKKNNVTNKDISFSKKFNFPTTLIQNTVFVKSKLDKWYIDVDKENKESILFHNNDGTDEEYHYQKTFKHNNLYKIFKYIKEHDDYCLSKHRQIKIRSL